MCDAPHDSIADGCMDGWMDCDMCTHFWIFFNFQGQDDNRTKKGEAKKLLLIHKNTLLITEIQFKVCSSVRGTPAQSEIITPTYRPLLSVVSSAEGILNRTVVPF